jgi:hypothetical protein
MRSSIRALTLAGLVALLATTRAVAAGPGHGCPHGHNCTHGHACHHGNPCAQSPRYDCLPLPPIAFSRYAENGDYDCTRHVFGDYRPKHPLFECYWYGYRQPYPVFHSSLP